MHKLSGVLLLEDGYLQDFCEGEIVSYQQSKGPPFVKPCSFRELSFVSCMGALACLYRHAYQNER